jgi:hypothetical protein
MAIAALTLSVGAIAISLTQATNREAITDTDTNEL